MKTTPRALKTTPLFLTLLLAGTAAAQQKGQGPGSVNPGGTRTWDPLDPAIEFLLDLINADIISGWTAINDDTNTQTV